MNQRESNVHPLRTDARTLKAAQRREIAVRRRIEGRTYREIAVELGVAVSTVHALVKRELARTVERTRADVPILIAAELDRIDALINAAWDKAEAGDCDAIRTIAGLIDRRVRLLGLGPPERVAPVDPSGQDAARVELVSLFEAAARRGPRDQAA